MRVIKKYPNRRLYDTEQSHYITLIDLEQLVMEGVEFVVTDANSGADITRTILLQIIAERESGGKPMFTAEILMRMIRFYGGSSQDALTQYLAHSLDLFDEQKKAFQQQFQDVVQDNPMTSLMSEVTKKNLEVWEDVQKNFLRAAGISAPDKNGKT